MGEVWQPRRQGIELADVGLFSLSTEPFVFERGGKAINLGLDL